MDINKNKSDNLNEENVYINTIIKHRVTVRPKYLNKNIFFE